MFVNSKAMLATMVLAALATVTSGKNFKMNTGKSFKGITGKVKNVTTVTETGSGLLPANLVGKGSGFGNVVRFSKSGNVLAVAAPLYDIGSGTPDGAVYIYNKRNQEWTLVAGPLPRESNLWERCSVGRLYR
jgi:hypothetical protein